MTAGPSAPSTAPAVELAVAVLPGRSDTAALSATVVDVATRCVQQLTGSPEPVTLNRRSGRRPWARQGARRVHLSISHTRGAVLAAASTHPVGVDVETCRALKAATGVRATLSAVGLEPGPGRSPRPDTAPGHDGPHCAEITDWCHLEAALKALGTGLALPLRRLGFDQGVVCLDGRCTRLRTHAVPLGAGLHAAVVSPSRTVPAPHRTAPSLAREPGATLARITTTQEVVMPGTLEREELRQLVADTIDLDVAEVTDEASFVDDLDVDSLMALEVMMVLERHYGVKLKEDRLADVTSLQAAYSLLEEELGKAS